MTERGTKKAMRELKRNQRALQYKLARDAGGGQKEQERRAKREEKRSHD